MSQQHFRHLLQGIPEKSSYSNGGVDLSALYREKHPIANSDKKKNKTFPYIIKPPLNSISNLTKPKPRHSI